MKTYTKSDVQFHADYCRRGYPAVNAKCYHFARGLNVEEQFGCDSKTAERALGFAWESACQRFWEDAKDTATHYLGAEISVHSEGRSSGWLCVDGLPDFESWDAIQLGKWRAFESAIKKEIEYLASAETVREEIEANQWAKPGAELYNFIDRKDGTTACIADLKQQAAEAGFAAVLR